ncbi:MAG: S8 family serine peptidase [Phycisphaerae bacterium]
MIRPAPITACSFILLAMLLSGCGVAPAGSGGTMSSVITDEPEGTTVFADDADPALAELPIVETELLVQPYPGADVATLDSLYAAAGSQVITHLEEIDLTVLGVESDRLHAVAEELAGSGLLENIHKNYVFHTTALPDDPLFTRQPYLQRIGVPSAWDTTAGDGEIIIAIVDTGVQADHPDLEDNILGGWNIVDGNADFDDVVGHGTQVAGVAAAMSNNGTGVAGVAGASSILAVRVTNDEGAATGRDIAAGIIWALGEGASVINVSFAPLWSNAVVRSAAQLAFSRGALVVISAGNGGVERKATGYPEALFVGAVNDASDIASFSDRGPFVDLVAPGTSIRSTSVGSRYRLGNGTSFAAPIVSGVAALAWSVNPELRPVSISEAIRDSAEDLGARGEDDTYGLGLVDAALAVDQAAWASVIPDDTPPSLDIDRPAPAAVLSGRYVARVTATDESGVADVVMFVDDIAVATDIRAPYRFVIETEAFSAGAHELAFVATDVVGNASRMYSMRVRFKESGDGSHTESSPSVTFESPASGSTVSGDVTIRATVTAALGLATVEWLVDGESVFVAALTGRSSGVSYRWRLGGVSSGRHTVTIVVMDQAGNRAAGDIELILR